MPIQDVAFDLLFSDETGPTRRESSPSLLTSLGGRRISADFMALPGNDMSTWSPIAARPVLFRARAQSAQCSSGLSPTGRGRTKSLSEVIDAEHPSVTQDPAESTLHRPPRKRHTSGVPNTLGAPMRRSRSVSLNPRVSFGEMPRRVSGREAAVEEGEEEAREPTSPKRKSQPDDDELYEAWEEAEAEAAWPCFEHGELWQPQEGLGAAEAEAEAASYSVAEYTQMQAQAQAQMQMQMQQIHQHAIVQFQQMQQMQQMQAFVPMVMRQMPMPMPMPMPALAMGHRVTGQAVPPRQSAVVDMGSRVPRGRVVAMATDPKGSRWLQDALPHMSAAQLEEVAAELAPQAGALACHPSGNYLLSRLAHLPSLQPHLAAGLRGRMLALATHPQGARVVQAALKHLPDATAADLVSELRGHVAAAAADVHGAWSLAAAYERCLPPFILDEISAELPRLAAMPHAGRAVQAVIAAAAAARLDLRPACASLLRADNALDAAALARHPFANYAVQLLLQHAPPPERAALAASLLPRLLALATSKHGSATAETLLQTADAAQLKAAAHLALAPAPAPGGGGGGGGGGSAMQRLCGCNYGNYVLQKLVKLSAAAERAALLDAVRGASTDRSFARIVLSRLGEPEQL